MPTLLIAKGILVTKSLEYTFIIALAFLFAISVRSPIAWSASQVALSSLGMAVSAYLLVASAAR